jgi:hypothetical protein
VDIAGLVESKLDLLRAHMSQVLHMGSLVDLEATESQARYRGFAARVREAEAFESHRFLWDPVLAERASASEVTLAELDKASSEGSTVDWPQIRRFMQGEQSS